jgi:hypothetical protein
MLSFHSSLHEPDVQPEQKNDTSTRLGVDVVTSSNGQFWQLHIIMSLSSKLVPNYKMAEKARGIDRGCIDQCSRYPQSTKKQRIHRK